MGRIEETRIAVIGKIEGGKYAPDAKLPTRHQLMTELGLARASVDKLIGELRDDGIVISIKGSGTYVAGRTDTTNIYLILNTELSCIHSQFMERQWNILINEMGLQQTITMTGCHDVVEQTTAPPSSAMVRSCGHPPQKSR